MPLPGPAGRARILRLLPYCITYLSSVLLLAVVCIALSTGSYTEAVGCMAVCSVLFTASTLVVRVVTIAGDYCANAAPRRGRRMYSQVIADKPANTDKEAGVTYSDCKLAT